MNIKLIFGLIVFSIGLSTVGFTSKRFVANDSDKARRIIKAYNAKCVADGALAFDVTTKLCECRTTEMFKRVSVNDMIILLHDDTRTLAEKAKVSTQDSDHENLSELEYEVGKKCEDKLLKK